MPAWSLHFVCHDFVPLPSVMKSVLHDFDTLSFTYVLIRVNRTGIYETCKLHKLVKKGIEVLRK